MPSPASRRLQARSVLPPGEAVGILRIPSIDLDVAVVEGTDTLALRRGPGHYAGTAYPWQPTGTTAIAGHRTTYGAPFWSLDDVERGDEIEVVTRRGVFAYRATGSRVVEPTATSVLEPTDEPTLVLTTCTPVFSDAQRLILNARRIGSRSPRASAS